MKKIIALSAIIIGLAGCSSDDPTANLESTLTHLLLNGTWISNCVTETPDSFKVVATLNDGIGSTEITEFSNNLDCSNNAETQPTETFTYIIGVDVTVDGSVAGITTATEIDTTDTTVGSPDFGDIDYDIFAIKDLNTLYIGDDTGVNDGTTAALRPTTLSSTITFTKQ